METPDEETTILTFSNEHILTLYYTYPNHRRLYMVCAKAEGEKLLLPCIDTPVSIIYKARGKKFDAIKHGFYILDKYTEKKHLQYPISFYREMAILAEENRLKSFDLKMLLKKFGKEIIK
ncbi:hypothetical protein [Treponema pedis]|nr:hypothetical protein [Treponema pedis]